MKGIFRAIGPQGFGTHRVDLADGQFESVEDSPGADLLVPGFVDIHIHGAFGIDFMSASRAEMAELCASLRDAGYEAFLPTTVTSSVEAVCEALSRLPDDKAILGFHAEGPFISPEYPGAQPAAYIVDPPSGPSDWDVVFDDPRLKVLTLAPERPGALALIRRLRGRDVRVGIGHTNATFAEAKAGYVAGATHTTHTYNAMRPLHHRETGTVGFALLEDELACELIYDRLHISRAATMILNKCKPEDKLIGVSDCTMAAGLPPGTQLQMWGIDAVTGPAEVRLPNGTLAGSAVTLYTVFRNLLADFGPETAIRACCLNPRKLLGLAEEPQVWLRMNAAGEILDRYEPDWRSGG